MPKRAKQRTEEPEPIKAIKKIAEQLSSSSYQERAKGEEALLEMGDDGPEAFAQLMRYEAARIKMKRKIAWGTLRNWVLIALAFWSLHLINYSFQGFNGVQAIT